MKNAYRKYGASAVLVAVLLLWGCGEDSSNSVVGPSGMAANEQRDAVADDYGAALAAPDEGMLRMWTQNDAGGGGLLAPERQGALDDTLDFTWNGFQVRRVRNFYDVLGNWSAIYDPETSVRMERLLWITGTHTNQSGRRTVTIDHFDSLMVTDIQPTSDVFTLSGAGDRTVISEFASRFDQNMKAMEGDYHWTVNDVQISRDWETHPYPLSGSIAVDATITHMHQNPGRDIERTVHWSFVVYFDGSQFAELVFADGHHYWIDLADGHPFRVRP